MSLKKIFISVFLFFSFFVVSSVSKPVFAFQTPDSSYPLLYQQAIESQDMNLQSFVRETIKAIMFSFADQAGMPKLSKTSDGANPGPGSNNGLIPTLAYFIGSVYQSPPASGVSYLADLGSKIGITKTAYAQDNGIGFSSMGAVLPMWKAFRDLSYFLFVLIFVITGFAIMFRFKVDPRTIITLEAALPKIVIGLILVTFSYAIAGFLIDLMWIINNLLLGIFHSLRPGYYAFVTNNPVVSVMGNINMIVNAGADSFKIGSILIAVLGMIAGGIVGIPFAGVGAVMGGAVGILIFLLLFVIVFLIALIRLLWTLLKAYVNIVLAIIFGPFLLALGALPGSTTTGGWFKNILSNLIVLPLVLIMLLVGNFLVRESLHAIPLLENALALFGVIKLNGVIQNATSVAGIQSALQDSPPNEVSTLFIMLFVSLGLMLMTPKIADMIKNVMAGKSFGDRVGFGIGEATGGLAGPVGMMGAGRAYDELSGTGRLGAEGSGTDIAAKAIRDTIISGFKGIRS